MRAPGDPIPPAPEPDLVPVLERPVHARWFQWVHYHAEWNTARLPVPGLAPQLDGLRIVHLSDLHLRRWWRPHHDDLVRRLEAIEPDLLLVTGDFVDNKRDHRPALPLVYRMLKSFRARLGCFGILGNHDMYSLGPELEGTNVRLLENRRHVIEVGDAVIDLIGLNGVARVDLDTAFVRSVPPRDSLPAGSVRIVLSHFPDHLRRTGQLQPDLFLAGHTHGGQVCLPGGVPIIKHDSLPRRLVRGVHRVGPAWLVVSRGLGTTTLPLRVFCPPEVIEIRLMSKT